MKTLLFCMLGLGLTACGSSPKGTNGDQDELAMLIGTYTNGSSKGMKKKLQELPMKIDIAESEEADEDDGEMWYYPMITE